MSQKSITLTIQEKTRVMGAWVNGKSHDFEAIGDFQPYEPPTATYPGCGAHFELTELKCGDRDILPFIRQFDGAGKFEEELVEELSRLSAQQGGGE